MTSKVCVFVIKFSNVGINFTILTFSAQAQLRKELNAEKFKNEVLSR